MWALGTGRRLQPAPAPGSGFPRVCSGVSSAPEQGHHMYWAPGTCAWGRGGLRTGLAPAVAPLAGARDLGSLARERTDPLGGHPFSLLWFVWNLNKTTLRQAREAACLWPPLRTLEAGRWVRRPRCPHARARARARPQGRPPEAEDAPPQPPVPSPPRRLQTPHPAAPASLGPLASSLQAGSRAGRRHQDEGLGRVWSLDDPAQAGDRRAQGPVPLRGLRLASRGTSRQLSRRAPRFCFLT